MLHQPTIMMAYWHLCYNCNACNLPCCKSCKIWIYNWPSSWITFLPILVFLAPYISCSSWCDNLDSILILLQRAEESRRSKLYYCLKCVAEPLFISCLIHVRHLQYLESMSRCVLSFLLLSTCISHSHDLITANILKCTSW